MLSSITFSKVLQSQQSEPAFFFASGSQPALPKLVLSCGVHGNETAPIEAFDRIVSDIEAGNLLPKMDVLVIFAHPESARRNSRYIETNLNRLFTDVSGTTVEHDIATIIKEKLARFLDGQPAFMFDGHTTIRGSEIRRFAMAPSAAETSPSLDDVALAAMGINAIVHTKNTSGTLSAYAAREHGARAFTLELGSARPFGENDLDDTELLEAALRDYMTNSTFSSASPSVEPLQHFQVSREIIKTQDSFELCFPEDINNFHFFSQGEAIAEQGDIRYSAQEQGEYLLFPNAKVENNARAAVLLRASK